MGGNQMAYLVVARPECPIQPAKADVIYRVGGRIRKEDMRAGSAGHKRERFAVTGDG